MRKRVRILWKKSDISKIVNEIDEKIREEYAYGMEKLEKIVLNALFDRKFSTIESIDGTGITDTMKEVILFLLKENTILPPGFFNGNKLEGNLEGLLSSFISRFNLVFISSNNMDIIPSNHKKDPTTLNSSTIAREYIFISDIEEDKEIKRVMEWDYKTKKENLYRKSFINAIEFYKDLDRFQKNSKTISLSSLITKSKSSVLLLDRALQLLYENKKEAFIPKRKEDREDYDTILVCSLMVHRGRVEKIVKILELIHKIVSCLHTYKIEPSFDGLSIHGIIQENRHKLIEDFSCKKEKFERRIRILQENKKNQPSYIDSIEKEIKEIEGLIHTIDKKISDIEDSFKNIEKDIKDMTTEEEEYIKKKAGYIIDIDNTTQSLSSHLQKWKKEIYVIFILVSLVCVVSFGLIYRSRERIFVWH